MQRKFRDLPIDEKRNIWWKRIQSQILEAAYYGLSGTPIAIGEGEDREWITSKIKSEGMEYCLFGETEELQHFALVLIEV